MRETTGGGVGDGHVTADGRVLLAILRYALQFSKAGYHMVPNHWLIAEADGRELQTLVPEGCSLAGVAFVDDRAVWAVADSSLGRYKRVALAGPFETRPAPIRIAETDASTARSWAAGSSAIYEHGSGEDLLLEWDGGVRTTIEAGPDSPSFVRDDVVVGERWQPRPAIVRWRPSDGLHDLIVGDAGTQGASALATDGIDMAWLEQTGADPDGPRSYAIMASPFAPEAADVRARLLRANVNNGTLIVGCGYVAHSSFTGVRVVRLSDGAAWRVQSSRPRRTLTAKAISCTEIFVASGAILPDEVPQVERWRLDALDGLGTAE